MGNDYRINDDLTLEYRGERYRLVPFRHETFTACDMCRLSKARLAAGDNGCCVVCDDVYGAAKDAPAFNPDDCMFVRDASWKGTVRGGEAERSEDDGREAMASWLRSLKGRFAQSTQWKPTEEQMCALDEAVNLYADSPAVHENDYLYNILVGLRNELKNL